MQLNDRLIPTVGIAAVIGVSLGVLIANGLRADTSSNSAYDGPPRPSAEAPVRPDAGMPPKPPLPTAGTHMVKKTISGEVVDLEDMGPVRLIGVDTRQGPGGKIPNPDISKAMLQRLVDGKMVTVAYDARDVTTDFKDESGMPLVYLTLEDGVLVNMEIVALGGAVARLDAPFDRRDDLIKAERDARWSGRGVWEPAARPLAPAPTGEMPSARRPPIPGEAPKQSIPSDFVLVTPDGRFHRQSCPSGKGGVPMSLEDARSKHYLADPRCFVSPKVKI